MMAVRAVLAFSVIKLSMFSVGAGPAQAALCLRSCFWLSRTGSRGQSEHQRTASLLFADDVGRPRRPWFPAGKRWVADPSQGVQRCQGLVHERWEDGARDGQAIWGGVCGNAAAAPDRGRERADPQGEDLILLVSSCLDPHLWL